MGTTLTKCPCGGTPVVMHARVAEDAEEAWVQCERCGRTTERCEDAYADFDTAEYLWQKGCTTLPTSRDGEQLP